MRHWWVDIIDGDILTLGLEMVEAWGRGVPRAWDRIGGSNHGTRTIPECDTTAFGQNLRLPVGLARLARLACWSGAGRGVADSLTGDQGPKVYAYGRRKDASCSMSSIKPICDDEWTAGRVLGSLVLVEPLPTATANRQPPTANSQQPTANSHQPTVSSATATWAWSMDGRQGSGIYQAT